MGNGYERKVWVMERENVVNHEMGFMSVWDEKMGIYSCCIILILKQ